jgi:L-fucose isomerase-like protein
MVGGMVLLAVGGTAAAIKMSQKDAQRVEEYTGASVEELSEDELVAAMEDLGIQSIDLSDADRAALTYEGDQAPAAAPPPQPATPAPASSESYLDELEKLADLRDRGIISVEDFEAKKKQLLGL